MKFYFATLASIVVAALLLAPGAQSAVVADAVKAAPKSESGFSFGVYGDSRPMMYLPPTADQPDVVKLLVEMYGPAMPEKVAEGGGRAGRLGEATPSLAG